MTRILRTAFLVPLTLTLTVSAAGPAGAADAAAGIVAGWDRHHGLALLGELHCAGCHAPGAAAEQLLVKQPPILAEVGGRVTPQYLRAFLADPQQVKAGSPMPNLLHALPARERDEAVDELVHYLVSLGGPLNQRSSGASRTQIERGKELYHAAGCVACHGPFEPPPKQKIDPNPALLFDEPEKVQRPPSPSVPLGELAMKTTVDALARFLSDPLHVRPSGRMPNLHLQPGEAGLLAAYLLRDQYTEKEKAPGVGLDVAWYQGQWSKVPEFDSLTPRWEGEAKGFDLTVLAREAKLPGSNFAVRFHGLIDIPQDGRYRFWTKSDDGSVLRIDGKRVVDNDGIHAPQEKEGQVELTRGRHEFEVGLIQGGGGYELGVFWQPPGAKERQPIPAGILLHAAAAMIPRGLADFQVDPARAERGQKRFTSLGCASCHATDRKSPPASPLKAPDLLKLNAASAGGCLGDEVAAGRPLYAVSDRQRQALREALTMLQNKPATLTPAARLDLAMTALNCYACHPRGDKGGPDPVRANYFSYEVVVDLGDEGRLPPPLTGVGAKLTPAGFDEALFSGRRYRSYMATRMPDFGKANVGHLPALFAQADAGKTVRHQPPELSRRLAEDGRKLVGKSALGCINCHAWGSHRLSGAEGLDLQQVTRRIDPGWFHAFLLDPQQFRRGTRMPSGWPGGKSFFSDIQDGDAHRQIDAIWVYLSAGEKGGLPDGLSPDNKALLVPAAEPIVFRTFLDQVSAHAILVGFPHRLHLAFDANRVRMVQAWSGDFISTTAAWEGRAGQYAKVPSLDVVRFPDGPPFARLEDLKAPWPADLPKQKLGSNRTPPGWRFLGYRYDAGRRPTFLYRIGDIDVEETPDVDLNKDAAWLVRRFHLRSHSDVPNLYLRLAAGKSIVQKNGLYLVDDRLRYRLEAASRPLVREVAGGQELLLPIDLKAKEVTLAVSLSW